MAILIDQDSEEAKERRKWEQFPSVYGPPGNPWKMRPFPAMLYRAQRIPPGMPGAGKWATGMDRPEPVSFVSERAYQAACESVDVFAHSCQMIVNDETEYKRAKAAGWCDTSTEAVEKAHAAQREIGDLTATRAYEDRNMSENAKAEAAAFEAENFGHQPEIPEKPKRKYTRRTAA